MQRYNPAWMSCNYTLITSFLRLCSKSNNIPFGFKNDLCYSDYLDDVHLDITCIKSKKFDCSDVWNDFTEEILTRKYPIAISNHSKYVDKYLGAIGFNEPPN